MTPTKIPIAAYIRAGARVAQCDPRQITSKGGPHAISFYRKAVLYLLRREGWTNAEISEFFDHGSLQIANLHREFRHRMTSRYETTRHQALNVERSIRTQLLPPLIATDEITDYRKDQK